MIFACGGHRAGGWATLESPVGATDQKEEVNKVIVSKYPLGFLLPVIFAKFVSGVLIRVSVCKFPKGMFLPVILPKLFVGKHLRIGQCIWQSLRFSLQWGA